ncbi:MAG: hypothetical protein ACFFD4_31015 [Candidatus Odinarchaeota archaeon]
MNNIATPVVMDKRKKIRNRIIELSIWEMIWGGIGFLFVGGVLYLIEPVLGLLLGLIGGILSYSLAAIFTNRCPYCDMVLPRNIEICPDCKRSGIKRE